MLKGKCIEFKGRKDRGYGKVWYKGKDWSAHRFVYTHAFGPIPKKMCVCHHCDNRAFINPDHLFLGTVLDNNRGMTRKDRVLINMGLGNPIS